MLNVECFPNLQNHDNSPTSFLENRDHENDIAQKDANQRGADLQSAVSRIFNPLSSAHACPVRDSSTACRLQVGDTEDWEICATARPLHSACCLLPSALPVACCVERPDHGAPEGAVRGRSQPQPRRGHSSL